MSQAEHAYDTGSSVEVVVTWSDPLHASVEDPISPSVVQAVVDKHAGADVVLHLTINRGTLFSFAFERTAKV